MDWRGAGLVALVLVAVFGCAQVDLPKTIYIEESWSDEDAAQIQRAIDEWNSFGREYCGGEIIVYGGRVADPSGFDPEIDPQDGHNTIYKVTRPDKNYEFLVAARGHDVGGYATKTDIFIFTFQGIVGESLYVVTLHEFGHWVGLVHIPDDPERKNDAKDTVMRPKGPEKLENVRLTRRDKQVFCIVHGCCHKDP